MFNPEMEDYQNAIACDDRRNEMKNQMCNNCRQPISKVEGFGWRHQNTYRYECDQNRHAEPTS